MQTQTMKLRELTIRYAVRKDHEGQPVIVGRALGRPSEAASALMTLLQDEPSEVFVVLCLTTKFHVIAYHEVGRGTLDTVLVNPRLCWAEHKRGYVAAVVMWGRSCIPCRPLAPLLSNAT
jgi:DNA repair protein RadC